MNAEQQDQILMSKIAAGCSRSMEQLDNSYRDSIRGVVRRSLRDSGEVDDVVQETLISVWRYAGQFRGDSKLFSWMCSIALRHAYRANRKDTVRYQAIEECKQEAITMPTTEANVDDQLAALEGKVILLRKIKSLPNVQQRAVMDAYFRDTSCRKIARAEGCSVGTIKSRLHYARKALHERLKPEWQNIA